MAFVFLVCEYYIPSYFLFISARTTQRLALPYCISVSMPFAWFCWLVAQVITLINSRMVIPYKPLHTLKSLQQHVSFLLQTFQITWTIWQSLPTNCRDRCKPSYNPFYVHSVALIPFAIIPFAKKKRWLWRVRGNEFLLTTILKLLVKKKGRGEVHE